MSPGTMSIPLLFSLSQSRIPNEMLRICVLPWPTKLFTWMPREAHRWYKGLSMQIMVSLSQKLAYLCKSTWTFKWKYTSCGFVRMFLVFLHLLSSFLFPFPSSWTKLQTRIDESLDSVLLHNLSRKNLRLKDLYRYLQSWHCNESCQLNPTISVIFWIKQNVRKQ